MTRPRNLIAIVCVGAALTSLAIDNKLSGRALFPSLSSASIAKEKDKNRDDNNNKNADKMLGLRVSHPGCFSDDLLRLDMNGGKHYNGRYLDVSDVARYIRKSKRAGRYDHVSCFVMKARYNCAKVLENTSSILTEIDWKLVLQSGAAESNQQPSRRTESASSDNQLAMDTAFCDVEALVEDVGGPAGVGDVLQSRRPVKATNATFIKPYTVVLHGNSILRQVWEALVCGWRKDITELTLYKGGPGISLADLAQRTHKITAEEMGQFLHFGDGTDFTNHRHLGCHSGSSSEIRHFYETDASIEIPTSIKDCNDNVAMVEFRHNIRFYYIFRPYVYENHTIPYKHLGLDAADIDRFVFNEGEDKKFPSYIKAQLQKGVFDKSWRWWRFAPFAEIQRRDTGRWYGASNPGIDGIDPLHPCMPGPPDDEVNLLLFLLLRDIGLKFN